MFSYIAAFCFFRPAPQPRPLGLPLFVGRVPAGFPSPAEDFADGVLDLNDLIDHPAATFIVRVAGDSMVGAGIFDGDLLVVDRSITPRHGHVVVVVADGEATVKRLEKRMEKRMEKRTEERGEEGGHNNQKRWWLVPANPRYRAMPLPEGGEIWGVVKNTIRSLT